VISAETVHSDVGGWEGLIVKQFALSTPDTQLSQTAVKWRLCGLDCIRDSIATL
jgi:hypothetical protein